MEVRAHRKLHDLLIIAEMRKIKPVKYSIQKQHTLWDGGDRVEERKRRFYVTLRHFHGEIIGRHVGLTVDVEKFNNNRGERRTYSLPVGTSLDEHLSVYVYNPAVCENGSLDFDISTTDNQCNTPTKNVCVEPDNCQEVFKFAYPSMQKGHVTRLLNRDDNYHIELHIILEGLE